MHDLLDYLVQPFPILEGGVEAKKLGCNSPYALIRSVWPPDEEAEKADARKWAERFGSRRDEAERRARDRLKAAARERHRAAEKLVWAQVLLSYSPETEWDTDWRNAGWDYCQQYTGFIRESKRARVEPDVQRFLSQDEIQSIVGSPDACL